MTFDAKYNTMYLDTPYAHVPFYHRFRCRTARHYSLSLYRKKALRTLFKITPQIACLEQHEVE